MTATSQGPRLATPHLDRLLGRLRARLVREVWTFGLGRTLLVLGVWLLFTFVVDWTLHVPAGVRLVHLAVTMALPSFVFWREVVRRLRCVPDRAGLAVLLERAHPELHELLVSAVELAPGGEGAPELVERVVREAEQRAATLELSGASDPGPAGRALGVGVAVAAVVALVLGVLREPAGVWLARFAGGDTPWPQRTHLVVEIPLDGELHSSEERLELAVARGADVPVLVRVRGDMPDEVLLSLESGQELTLGRAGRDVFRTLLRSVQEDLAFTLSGGDDDDGTPAVTLHVLQPPDVVGVAVAIEPPAYSGLPARVEFDRDVQVLAGSRVVVTMRSDPPETTGVARLLPEDRELALEPRAFPARLDEAPLADPRGRGFELVADHTLRYRFELRDAGGLTNPDPGLFAIDVEPDRAPEVELLAPARGEVETVVGGALPLRALVSDDFGLGLLSWTSQARGAQDAAPRVHPLVGQAPAVEEPGALGGRAQRARLTATTRLEVNELFGDAPPTEGEVFELVVVAEDNRAPEPQEGRSAPTRLRVVSADEFLRRVQDRLGRVRTKVDALADLAREKQGYTRDLIASVESDEPAAADASAVEGALAGARRVQGDARALTRELCAVTEAMLYSRLDERAGPLLEAYDERASARVDRSFHAEPWQELVALQASGALGRADFADRLIEMVGAALELSELHGERVVVLLRELQDQRDLEAAHDTLLAVDAEQSAAAVSLEELLRLLAEWDNYQSILTSTRDLLNRQKNLLDRTRQFYKDN
ncbi:MAG: hypothetical protein H6828_07550 [Planctomycetes bacterium]|nr:hypothetical protein [Planctomycetota bacterium]